MVLSVVDRLPAATEASWNSSDGPRVAVSANDPLPERSLHGAGHRRQKAFVRALRPGRRQHLGASSGWLPLTRARLVAVTTTSSSCFSTSAMEYYKLPHYGRLRFEVHAGRSLRRRHDVPHSVVIVRRSMLHVSRQKSLKDLQQVNVDDKSSIRHVLLQLKCWYVLDYGS